MKQKAVNLPIIGAVLTALLSTLCCLPAFLFLFFGISSTALTFLTHLEFIRIPLALLACVFFIVGFIKQNRKISCECSQKNKLQQAIISLLVFLAVLALLFYPEFLPLFLE